MDVAPAVGYGPYLDADNYSAQHGQLVTEIMPGQNLPLPFIGKRVAVFGTWVHDEEHGWNEIHPIWAIRYLDSGRTVQSLPVAPPVFAPDAGSGVGTSGKGALECDSSYVVSGGPCLKEAIGDYDCYGGGGDGPNYTPPGALIRVVGKDSFGLDADRDGIACE